MFPTGLKSDVIMVQGIKLQNCTNMVFLNYAECSTVLQQYKNVKDTKRVTLYEGKEIHDLRSLVKQWILANLDL